MALQFIGTDAVPTYIALSTDIADSKITGAIAVGKLVYTTDDSKWFVIEKDLTLSEYALPVTFSGTISVGAVSTGISGAGVDGLGNFISILSAPGSVNEAPLATFPYVYNGTSWDRLRGTTTGLQTLDMGFGRTTSIGVSGAVVTSADASGAGVNLTDAPTSGQKIVVTDVIISSVDALSVNLVEETSGTVLSTHYIPAGSTVQFSPRGKFKLATANKKLKLIASGAGNISVTVIYYSEL